MSLAKSRGAQKKATTTIAATTTAAFVTRRMFQVVSSAGYTPTFGNGLAILVGLKESQGIGLLVACAIETKEKARIAAPVTCSPGPA